MECQCIGLQFVVYRLAQFFVFARAVVRAAEACQINQPCLASQSAFIPVHTPQFLDKRSHALVTPSSATPNNDQTRPNSPKRNLLAPHNAMHCPKTLSYAQTPNMVRNALMRPKRPQNAPKTPQRRALGNKCVCVCVFRSRRPFADTVSHDSLR